MVDTIPADIKTINFPRLFSLVSFDDVESSKEKSIQMTMDTIANTRLNSSDIYNYLFIYGLYFSSLFTFMNQKTSYAFSLVYSNSAYLPKYLYEIQIYDHLGL